MIKHIRSFIKEIKVARCQKKAVAAFVRMSIAEKKEILDQVEQMMDETMKNLQQVIALSQQVGNHFRR